MSEVGMEFLVVEIILIVDGVVVAVYIFRTDIEFVKLVDRARPVELGGMLDEIELEVVGGSGLRHRKIHFVVIFRFVSLFLVGG